MYVPFINRGMKHPCAQFADNTPMSYADEPYFRKPLRIDEQFGVGQQFSTKSELKVKITDFHVQQNIKLEVTNSSKLKLVMKCKDSNYPWRMYATPNITGIWEIRTNPLEHSYFGSATRADHSQMTSRMIADILKNQLKENLEMIVKETRGLVKQKFPTVQPSYNKLWRGRELAIADIFGSWEMLYEMLPTLLAAIQNFTYGIKYIIETAPSTKFGVKIFDRVAWAFGPCITVWHYLRPVLTIDAGFLSDRYVSKLFMACGYDAEQ
jgi:hypothetical protein